MPHHTQCRYLHTHTHLHTLTFIIESIYSVDTCTLMVAAKKKEVLWVLDLVCQQETSALNRVLPSVHIVSKEEVVCFRRKPSYLKQS